MYKVSDFRQELYKPGDLMKILNVTYQTIKNYDISGKLPIKRTETGRRVVTREDLLRYLEERGLLYNDESKIKSDYIYARVSSNEQKTKGDLDRQVCYIVENVSVIVIEQDVLGNRKLILDYAAHGRNIVFRQLDIGKHFHFVGLGIIFADIGNETLVAEDNESGRI